MRNLLDKAMGDHVNNYQECPKCGYPLYKASHPICRQYNVACSNLNCQWKGCYFAGDPEEQIIDIFRSKGE